MTEILGQINAVIEKYPSLVISSTKDGHEIAGTICMDKTYNDIPLYKEYPLKIVVPETFPLRLPVVYVTDNSIPVGFNHQFTDGSLCLGAQFELFSFLEKSPSLLSYIDEIIMSYLYSAAFWGKYGVFPYGERSHGFKGIWEAFKERYNTEDDVVLIELLLYISGEKKYRGHVLCPCGSTKHFRSCHGEQILSDIKSPRYSDYKAEANSLISFIRNELSKLREETQCRK